MPSHMAVQTLATKRNSQVEFLIHFILNKFMEELSHQNLIRKFNVESQKQYTSHIAADIWDHFVSAERANGRRIEIWCQTTSYKGGTGRAESNKTYEIRETLVEAISLREHTSAAASIDARTIHFTVGDSNYTYQWFMSLKTASFDHSIYIGDSSMDIFALLSSVLGNASTERDKSAKLEAAYKDETPLGLYIRTALANLSAWFLNDGMPKSKLAELQWQLVEANLKSRTFSIPDLSKIRGSDIKDRANRLLFGDSSEDDPLLIQTVKKVLDKNPFLSAARAAVSDWNAFKSGISSIEDDSRSLTEYINRLWTATYPTFLITRRVLLRLHSETGISYIQDRNVEGITEHNLYGAEHTAAQVESICEQIEKDLSEIGVTTPHALTSLFFSKGKRIIDEARWFEARNGTQLKPTFEYVELALQASGYKVLSPSKARINAVGYHAQIASESVKAYTNLKVVRSGQGKNLCFLKAKFFRKQEFARRCKEEAFVGLSLRYSFNGTKFAMNPLPLIMYVDMAVDCVPPEYTIRRLKAFGWEIAFSLDELKGILRKMEKQ